MDEGREQVGVGKIELEIVSEKILEHPEANAGGAVLGLP